MKLKRRHLQFSVLTLFVIMTITAVGSHWFAARRRTEAAEEQYHHMNAGFDAGMNAEEEVYRASVNWLNAALQVPLCRREQQYKAHLARMTHLENRCLGFARLGMFDSMDGKRRAQSEAEKTTKWRHEAEEWVKTLN